MHGNDSAAGVLIATTRILAGLLQDNSLARGYMKSQIGPVIFPVKGASDMNIFSGEHCGGRFQRRALCC